MRSLLLNGGCGLLLLVAGWFAGRHFQSTPWPASPAAPQAEPVTAVSPSTSELPPSHQINPAASARAAGEDSGENAVRDAARNMALAPPPALQEFLATAADTDVLRAALLDDAVFWAFCRNPAAGLAQLSVLPDTPGTQALFRKTLHFFPPKDLPLVFEWYQKLPAGELRLSALREINPVLARREMAKAIALTAALPPDTADRKTLLASLLTARVDLTDPGTWEKELSAFPAGDRESLQLELVSKQFQSLSYGDKAGAVALLSGLPAAEYNEKAVDLFRSWAENDPLRAAPEIGKLPEAYQTPELYSAFARKWAEGNVGSSSGWVNSLPKGPARNSAAKGLALGLTKDYPAEALVWAATLSSAEERAQSVESILSDTSPHRRAGLESAIAALPLEPDEIAALQNLSPP